MMPAAPPNNAPPAPPMSPRRAFGFIVYALTVACQQFTRLCDTLVMKKKHVLTFFGLCIVIEWFLALQYTHRPLWIPMLFLVAYVLFIVSIQFEYLRILKVFRTVNLVLIFCIVAFTLFETIIFILAGTGFRWLLNKFLVSVIVFFNLLIQLHLLNGVIFDIEQHSLLHVFTIDDEPRLVENLA